MSIGGIQENHEKVTGGPLRPTRCPRGDHKSTLRGNLVNQEGTPEGHEGMIEFLDRIEFRDQKLH